MQIINQDKFKLPTSGYEPSTLDEQVQVQEEIMAKNKYKF